MRVVLAAVFVAWAVPAYAQITPRTPRPDWGLFGSGVADVQQKLILTANFGGGYEDDLSDLPSSQPPPPGVPGVPRSAYTGPFGTASAALTYSVDKDGLRGGLSFSAAGRNYREQDTDPFVGTYSLRGNVSWDVSSRGSLAASIWAGQYLQNLAPGYDAGTGGPIYPGVPSVPGDPGVYGSGDTYIGVGTNVSYDHQITTKISGYGGASFYLNDAWSDVDSGRYDSQFVNAGLRYTIGKGLSARAGYGATIGGLNQGDIQYRSGTIDAGVDYSGSLSVTRKSTLGFSTGASGLQDVNGKTHYYFVGNVNYNYEIGRSWSAGIGAYRNTDFFQTLGQPSVTDSVNGHIGGTIGRRVNASVGGGWYRGTYAGADTEAYTSTSGNASVQYAISRMFSLAATYSYYRYEYGQDAALPPGFFQATKRQSIRLTLNTFLPLYTKARRP